MNKSVYKVQIIYIDHRNSAGRSIFEIQLEATSHEKARKIAYKQYKNYFPIIYINVYEIINALTEEEVRKLLKLESESE